MEARPLRFLVGPAGIAGRGIPPTCPASQSPEPYLRLFALAAAGCGLAGALTLANSLRVQPESVFSIQWTAFMIFCAVIGGIGTLEGPVLGAVVFFVLEDRLADSGTLYLVALGALAIAIAAFLPAGLWGEAQKRLGVTLFPVGHRLVLPAARRPADAVAASAVAAAGDEDAPSDVGDRRNLFPEPSRSTEFFSGGR